ncbi:MAG: hypothetical protein CMA84_02055 [Euryarchaeota archaeon]|nr:hypothetical protein [Euryarchaeota archaeon]
MNMMACLDSQEKTCGLMPQEQEFCRAYTKRLWMLNLQSVQARKGTREPRKQLRKLQQERLEMAILGIDLSTLDLASITENIFFFILASIVIGGALGLIYAQRVAHSMMALIFCFMGVAGIFILMSAEFIAVIQILVYLASVMLVVLFGIMLTRRQILEEDFE